MYVMYIIYIVYNIYNYMWLWSYKIRSIIRTISTMFPCCFRTGVY